MRKWVLLLLLLLTFGSVPTFAQTNESPLLQMLARVPDTPSAREYISYVDYKALLAARQGVPQITTWEQLSTLLSSKSKEGRLAMAALQGIQSGPEFYARYFMQAGDAPSVVGFDLLTIERAIEFGSLPDSGDILEGSFDAQAVAAAHEKRGYTSSDLNSLTLLCPAAGCDSGKQLDMAQINPANPFGGELGRSQPVLVGDNLVASSPNIDTVRSIASAIADPSTSLADQPDYRAAAEAISANGTLIQSYLIRPADIQSAAAIIATSRLSAAQIKRLTDQLRADFVPMPAYNLIALADIATDSEQQALVALVYTNQADAEAAAALFPDRLGKYTSLATQRVVSDLLTERGVTSVDTSVYAASTKRSVLVITLHAPLPSSAIPADGSPLQSSSLIYSLLVRVYMSRDLGWLATQF